MPICTEQCEEDSHETSRFVAVNQSSACFINSVFLRILSVYHDIVHGFLQSLFLSYIRGGMI